MKALLPLLFISLLHLGSPETLFSQVKNPIEVQVSKNTTPLKELGHLNLIMAVDTSGSMKKIFPDLKKDLKQFVQKLNEGDIFTLIPFDTQPRTLFVDEVLNSRSRKKILTGIDALSARGAHTDLWKVMESLKEHMARARKAHPFKSGLVLILSDNLHDPPPEAPADPVSLTQVAKNFYEGFHWNVYAISLQADLPTPAEKRKLEREPNIFSKNFRGITLMQTSENLGRSLKMAKENTNRMLLIKLGVSLSLLFFIALYFFRKSVTLGLVVAILLLSVYFVRPLWFLNVSQTLIALSLVLYFYLEGLVMALLSLHPAFSIIPISLSLLVLIYLFKSLVDFGSISWDGITGSASRRLKRALRDPSLTVRRQALLDVYHKPPFRDRRPQWVKKLVSGKGERFQLIPSELREFQKKELIQYLKGEMNLSAIVCEDHQLRADLITCLLGGDLLLRKALPGFVPLLVCPGRDRLVLYLKDGRRFLFKWRYRKNRAEIRSCFRPRARYNPAQFHRYLEHRSSSILSLEFFSSQAPLGEKALVAPLPEVEQGHFKRWSGQNHFFAFLDRVLYVASSEEDWHTVSQVQKLAFLSKPVHVLLNSGGKNQSLMHAIQLKERINRQPGFEHSEVIPVSLQAILDSRDNGERAQDEEDLEFLLSYG